MADELTWVEEALQSSGDLFARVLETSSNSIAINRLEDQAFLYVNAAFERVTGWSRDEVLGHPPGELGLLPDPQFQATITEALADDGQIEGIEGRFRAKDGSETFAEISAQRIELGGVPCVLSVSRDLTEHRRAADELMRREALLGSVVEHVPAFIYMESPGADNADLYVSPQYESLFGVPLEERLADPGLWRRLVHPDDLPLVLDEAARTNETGEIYLCEYRIKRPEGGWKWVRDEAVLIRDEAGEPLHWFGVVVDVSDRRHAEEELRSAETKYRQLVERLPAVTYQELVPRGKYGEGSMIYLSPQAEEILGYDLSEFGDNADRFWDAIVHPDDRQRVFDESVRTAEAREAFRDEYRVRTKSGEVLWFHDEATLVREDPENHTQVWHGVMFDITERKRVEAELRETEQRYRSLIERIPAVTYIDKEDPETDVGWTMTYVSPQIEAISGYPPEDWVGTDLWLRILHPADRGRILDYDEATVKSGEPYSSEYRIIARDGRTVWIQEEASVLMTADDTRYWQGVMFDITERRRSEDDLQRRDSILQAVGDMAELLLHARAWDESLDGVLERLGEAADASRVYIFENHIDTGILLTTVTHEWVAAGIEPQLEDAHLQDLPLAQRFQRWIDTLSGGQVVTGLVSGFPEGERRELERQHIRSILAVPVFVDDDWWGFLGFDECREDRVWSQIEIEALRTAAGIIGTAIRRQRAEEQLREAEERYRQLVERTPAVVYMDAIDDLSTALYISPQLKDLLGYTPEERLAEPGLWVQRLHPDDRDRVVEESKRTNDTGDPFAMDYRMVHRDGHTVWVRDESILVHGEDGAPRYWLGVLIDITERKRAEDELAHALDMERQAAEQLRALDEMKNTFLTAVSHDLRTPLAAVLGLALTLEREDVELDPAETKDLARRIATNARKLDRMVVDLLDLDRLTRGVLELKLNRTDVGFLVRKVVDEAEFMGDHPVVVEADPVIAAIDLAKVERIVENLLANAARHTPKGTQIWVRVLPFEAGVLISVDDAGPGVVAELKEAVFEPFQQGHAADIAHSPGVGIGLSLVARFTELHGGRVWIEDREGGGASFRVYLPDGEGLRVATGQAD